MGNMIEKYGAVFTGVFIVALVVALGAVLIMAISSSSGEQEEERPVVEGIPIKHGEMLYTKLTGDNVQVLAYRVYTGQIKCRVAHGRIFRDGVVSKDNYTTSYVMVYFYPAELTRTKPEKGE